MAEITEVSVIKWKKNWKEKGFKMIMLKEKNATVDEKIGEQMEGHAGSWTNKAIEMMCQGILWVMCEKPKTKFSYINALVTFLTIKIIGWKTRISCSSWGKDRFPVSVILRCLSYLQQEGWLLVKCDLSERMETILVYSEPLLFESSLHVCLNITAKVICIYTVIIWGTAAVTFQPHRLILLIVTISRALDAPLKI